MATPKTLEQTIRALIEKWAKRLHVLDYRYFIELGTDRQLHGDYAEVDTDDETREVTIRFNQDRLRRESDELERTVVHELLHTRFSEYAALAISFINEHLSNPRTRRMLKRLFERLEHKIVAALADALLTKDDGTL